MLERPARPMVRYFYKYSAVDHLEWLESIILKSELYFPTLTQLNDPADARPRLSASSLEGIVAFLLATFVENNPGRPPEDYQRAALEIEYNSRRFGKDWLLKEMTSLLHRQQDNHRIYSLSKRWDNLSMWAKYAGGHSGYCLEFANDGPPFTSAYEVIYDGPVTLDMTDQEQMNAYFFFHKSMEWHNEEEVRIITPRNSPAVIKFEPRLLTRIILGKDMSEAHRNKIREWAQDRRPELVVVCAEYDAFEQRLVVGDPVVSGI